MKKIIFIILVLFTACTSKKSAEPNKPTESKKAEILFPFGFTTFSWKGIEKQDEILKAQFVKQAPVLIKSEYEFYNTPGNTEKIFGDYCHVLDINNDGLNDIMYIGSTGGEGSEVVIFLNTKNGFKNIFKQLQHIKKLEFKENRLSRLYIYDDGCCADYNDFNRIYEVNYNSNIPKFNTIYFTANTHKAYFPKKYFNEPIYFQVLNNNYKMRDSAAVDDTTKNGMGGIEFIGNNIDTLNKGTKGRAIASQTDKTGRVWWLVEIDSSYHAYGNLFYKQEGEKRTTSKMGWISSRYVKQIVK